MGKRSHTGSSISIYLSFFVDSNMLFITVVGFYCIAAAYLQDF